MAEQIRVLVCESTAAFRDWIVRVLNEADDIVVAVQTSSAGAAVAEAANASLEFAILDPGQVEDRTVRMLAGLGVKVLAMVASSDADTALAAIRLGARGYLSKDRLQPWQIAVMVRLVHEDTCLASLEAWRSFGESNGRRGVLSCPCGRKLTTAQALTERELEVYRLVAKGASNADVAAAIRVSIHTVKAHLGHIFDKLGARSRWDLMRLDLGAATRPNPPPSSEQLELGGGGNGTRKG